MGRNKYSQREIDIIAMLLRKKNAGTRLQQKKIRHQLRVNFEFYISDFNEPGKAFGDTELQEAIKRGAIKILDEAEKQEEAIRNGATDWQAAMKEWEEWEAKEK